MTKVDLKFDIGNLKFLAARGGAAAEPYKETRKPAQSPYLHIKLATEIAKFGL